MMELKRFKAVGGNELPVFDVGAGNVRWRVGKGGGSRAKRGGIWSM